MKFNANKFEHVAHRKRENVEVEPYKTPLGEPITMKDIVKDRGVYSTNDLMFKDHMNKIINSSKIIMGMLLRTFSTRKKEPMLKMFNTYIKLNWNIAVSQKSTYELKK